MNVLQPTSSSRRTALAQMGSLVLMLGAADIAHGASILAVRVWPARDYTRVTIESDQPLSATHVLVEAPHRLGVDISGLELNTALRELVGQIKADDPYIASVRVGQFQPRVVRLVFDLKVAIRPEQFTLLPVAAYRHRLVFDLFPVLQFDPLLALVREREAAEAQAQQAVQDALGELITRLDKPGLPAPATAMAPAPGPAPGSAAAPATGLPAPAAPSRVATAPPQQTLAPPTAPTAAERQAVDRLIIVALDPGHGGEDPGAIGPSGLREKDVVLAVALMLRDKLNAQRGMRVMLTRDGDFFVPLRERVRKAQRVQADLFVSIHADAFNKPHARGASVFALSQRGASSAAARWMAQRENAADAVGGVNLANVQDKDVAQAMLDMSTTAQIKDSLKLGKEVLGRIGRVGHLHKRQVEQAGFAVLKAPDIPSILIETAFISNPEEEKKLRDEDYRAELVLAMADGIKRYFALNPPLARQRQL